MIFRPLFSTGFIVLFSVLWVLVLAWSFRRGKNLPALIRRGLLGLVLVAAMVGPSVPAEEETVSSNVEIYLAIDRTGSMAAQDWDGDHPRLDGVKRDIMALVDATAGARYSIITWDSVGRLELPITTDSSAVQSFTDTLHQEITKYSSASSLDRPLWVLQEEILGAAKERPQNSRFLVVFTDGEDTSQDSGDQAMWSTLKDAIDGGAVVGYGTEAGAPMKVYDPELIKSGTEPPYMTDENGNEARSHIDKENLQSMAKNLGVGLLVNPSVKQMQDLGQQFMSNAKELSQFRNTQHTYRLVVWPLAGVGALLVCWELWVFAAQVMRLRRTNAL